MDESNYFLPTVSIIIPVYNLGALVHRSLDSCCAQTFKNLEILVVNDGSNDSTFDVLEAYKKKDTRIVVLHKVNEGVNIARKTGVENAKGKYVFFLDGDDIIPSDTIGALLTESLKNDADIVAGDVVVFKNGMADKKSLYSVFTSGTGVAFLEFILANQHHYLVGKLIKRTLYTENEITVNKEVVIGEDQVQIYQLCMYAQKVSTINYITYHYLINPVSATQKKTSDIKISNNLEQYAFALFELTNRFSYNAKIKQALRFRIIKSFYIGLLTSGRFVNPDTKMKKAYSRSVWNAAFCSNSMLFTHTALIARACLSLINPKVTLMLRKMKVNVNGGLS